MKTSAPPMVNPWWGTRLFDVLHAGIMPAQGLQQTIQRRNLWCCCARANRQGFAL